MSSSLVALDHSSDSSKLPSGNRKWIRANSGQSDSDGSHLAVLWGFHPIRLVLIDQQAPPLVSSYGRINHPLTSIWITFLRKSSCDGVDMKFKGVDLLMVHNRRFLLERMEMMILGTQLSKMNEFQQKVLINKETRSLWSVITLPGSLRVLFM